MRSEATTISSEAARTLAGGLSAAVLGIIGGCTFDTGGRPAVPAVDAAEPPDAEVIECVPWSATNVDPCDQRLPAAVALELTGGAWTYDTITGALTGGAVVAVPSALIPQDDGSSLRVINAERLVIPAAATIAVVGAHALVIVVHGDATVDGGISVSSSSTPTPTPGPGASDAACAGSIGGNGSVGTGTSGGGGGGGGAFAADSGKGSDGGGPGRGDGGPKGNAVADADLSPLRGGCRAGKGGDLDLSPGDTGGLPGQGGGAIEITARGALAVTGQIAANGSAGRGGGTRSGGGGGGSGGGILLEASTVALADTAALCANGAGGGEGGSAAITGTGAGGQNGLCAETAAPGGGETMPTGTGGNGGRGGALADQKGGDGESAMDGSGGGGGGGSAGRIRIRAFAGEVDADDAMVVSPKATLEP
jgi:hypothetical protein